MEKDEFQLPLLLEANICVYIFCAYFHIFHRPSMACGEVVVDQRSVTLSPQFLHRMTSYITSPVGDKDYLFHIRPVAVLNPNQSLSPTFYLSLQPLSFLAADPAG